MRVAARDLHAVDPVQRTDDDVRALFEGREKCLRTGRIAGEGLDAHPLQEVRGTGFVVDIQPVDVGDDALRADGPGEPPAGCQPSDCPARLSVAFNTGVIRSRVG